jgi:hypothetical protein
VKWRVEVDDTLDEEGEDVAPIKEGFQMSRMFALGDYVLHPTRGLGKVVSADSSVVRVYFRDVDEPAPEDRVKQFNDKGSQMLTGIEPLGDVVLDNLPPWKDGKFQRFKTDLTIDAAKRDFLRRFPGGIDDPEFRRAEIDYKRSAHQRYKTLFEPFVRGWVAQGNNVAIAAALDQVYGDPRAPKIGADTRLNLLYQKVEEPAYFDALRGGGDFTTQYAKAALDFIEQDGTEQFDRYVRALEQLPTREGGAQIDLWTTLTWLPFVAVPDQHVLIKPTIIQSFASALAFEPNYKSQLNHLTYRSVQNLAESMRETLRSSEVNLRGRELDMIDVQSFMWVVARYQGGEGTKPLPE